MPLTYRQVKDLYDTLSAAGVTQASLPDWAAEMNRLNETDLYSAGLHDDLLKRASVGLDRLLERTGLPEKSGEFGAAVGGLIGAEEQGRTLGESLPRMAVEFAPMAIPVGGWAATAAKLGLTGLLSGARTYTETDSPAAGLLTAATNMVMPTVAGRAEQAILKTFQGEAGRIAGRAILDGGIQTVDRFIPQNVGQGLTSLLAGQGAAAALGEASGFGQQALAGQPLDFDWKASLLGMTLGQVPFTLPYLTRGGRVQFGGATAREEAASLRANIVATEAVLAREQALRDAKNEGLGLDQVPDFEQKKVSPERLAEVNMRLDAIRGKMQELKAEATPSSMEEWNRLSKEENDLIAEQSGQQKGTVMGRKMTEGTERIELEGKEVFRNKAGTYRIIELPNGKRVGYSTLFEPEAADLGNGLKRFSLPKGYMSEVTDKYGKPVVDPTQPDLPEGPENQPNFDHVTALAEVEAELGTAKSAADFDAAVQKLNTVREVYDLPPLNDRQIALRKKLTGNDSTKAAIIAENNKTRRQVKAKLSPEEKAAQEEVKARQQDSDNLRKAEFRAKKGDIGLPELDSDTTPIYDTLDENMAAILDGPDSEASYNQWLKSAPSAEKTSLALERERYKLFFMHRALGDVGKEMELSDADVSFLNELFTAEGVGVADPKSLKDFPERDHVLNWDDSIKERFAMAVSSPPIVAAPPLAGPSPATPGLHAKPDETPFIPKAPQDAAVVKSVGNTGKTLVDHLFRSKNPLLNGLAKDLAQYPDLLDRIKVGWFEMGRGSYAVGRDSRTVEIRMNSSHLWADDAARDFTLAHELLHGISLHELDNPIKKQVVDQLTDLRKRLVVALPKDLKTIYDKAVAENWYERFARGEQVEPLTDNQRHLDIVYALFNNHELISQGFSAHAFREFAQSVRAEGKVTWWHKFVNYVKQLTGIGEAVDNNAFGELLSLTSQLARNANAVATFSNFSDRWFEGRGFTPRQARAKTQQAMGLLANASLGTSSFDLFNQLFKTSHVSLNPDVMKTRNRVTLLQKSQPEAWDEMQQVLVEVGVKKAGFTGLDSLILEGLDGRDVEPAISLLPPEAQSYIFSRLNDWRETLDVVRAASLDKNRKVSGLTDPKNIRGPVKEALKAIDKVLDTESMLDQAIGSIQKMNLIYPDAFLDQATQEKVVGAAPQVGLPEQSVLGFLGDVVGKTGTWVNDFINKPAQLARTNPVWAEAFSLASSMKAIGQHSGQESVKIFGHKIENGVVSDKFDTGELEKVFNGLQNPKARKAVDKWMEWNNKKGKDKVVMLPETDPDVAKYLAGLRPGEREIVTDVVNKIALINADKNRKTLSAMQDIAVNLGARIIMAGDKGKLSNALAISKSLFQAVTANFQDPQAAAQANSLLQQVQAKMSIETYAQVLRFAQNEAANYKSWEARFRENPQWASARRIGKFGFERLENGRWVRDAADTKEEARQRAKGQPVRNFRQMEGGDEESPTMGDVSDEALKKFQEYEANRIAMLRESGLASPELIQELERLSPAAMLARDAAAERQIDPTLPPNRKLSKLSEDHPWLLNYITGVFRNAHYWSRRTTRIKAETMLADPEVAANPELQKQIRTYFDNLFYPDPQLGQGLTKFTAVWGLGFNMATNLANLSQTPMRLLPELIRLNNSPIKALGQLTRAWKDYASNRKSQLWNTPEEQWFMQEATNLGHLDATLFDVDSLAKDNFAENYMKVLKGTKPKTLGSFLSSLTGGYAHYGMWFFRQGERANNSVALLASYRTLKELNPTKPKEWLRDQAFLINAAVNDVGGRANRSVGLFNNRQPFTRNLAMVYNSLQAYTIGSTFQLIRFVKEGFGRTPGLKPSEQFAARKAALTMLSVQFAAAGLLGMPFMSAALTLLDKAFPEMELRRKLRENVASFFREDESNDIALTDLFMSGGPSMLGWDMQPRLSMGNNLPGVNELSGFDPAQLLGAPAGIISRAFSGGTQLLRGDVRGIYSFIPPFIKKSVELAAEQGKILDYKDRPIIDDVTPGEGVGIALGFNPTRLARHNSAQRIKEQAEDVANRREAQFHQQLAEDVIAGKFGSVKSELINRRNEEEGFDPVAAARSVARVAEDLVFPRDLRREGTAGTVGQKSKLLQVFGLPASQPNEELRFQFRQQLLQRLGVPQSGSGISSELSRARLMDQLRLQNPEATRSELRRAAEGALRRTPGMPRELLQ